MNNSLPIRFTHWLTLLGVTALGPSFTAAEIPLPEHPRPDFQRAEWQNLNGQWEFEFDADDQGTDQKWQDPARKLSSEITVPFSWGAPLSGVKDQADIGWYARSIQVPPGWNGQRVFLVVGACDWHTTVWLDGHKLGEHRGGYTTPFAFDLTEHLRFGQSQRLVFRVDDTPHAFKLEGKQGYGRAAGIWQTVYLEARPSLALETVHFTPDIDAQEVRVDVTLDQPATDEISFQLRFQKGDRAESVFTESLPQGVRQHSFVLPLKEPRLWSLDDPYLYYVQAVLKGPEIKDTVDTYFGMRKISTGKLPGTDHPYVMLNDQPIYLQLALDQAYHPEGYYTFPNDAFMRDEILRSRQIGLNGQRIHIKVEVPRKLYWADRLGVLIMADVPNSWGPPEETMRGEIEYALRGMIRRDYNHPAIFSWVDFNETWGLRTGDKGYLPETQDWVEQIYKLTKQLDATRLVEDNSPCNHDHVATDINTWHAYLPGYEWRERLDQICRDTHAGSEWNYIGGRKQGNQPMFNSECGNVWGYQGSTGDVDWSWDYHIMINEFRRHPLVCGWLYTEHHDVINEWNGYWRYDRSRKFTGMPQLADGMTLRDLHGTFYIATERELCRQVSPGATVQVPLYASFMTGQNVGESLSLDWQLYGWNTLGTRCEFGRGARVIPFQPWMNRELQPLELAMPKESGLAVLVVRLRDDSGAVLHRNFTTYLVADGESPRQETLTPASGEVRVVRFAPGSFRTAEWSGKQWQVMEGLKVNGAGSGFFEYSIPWPEDLDVAELAQVSVRMEVSAKQLFGKDREDGARRDGDFMRGKGTHDPSSNPNSYPMTDETQFPSAVRVRVMDHAVGTFELPDDSADHRGILSWFSQKRDGRLREAGSYGYLIDAKLPQSAIEAAAASGSLVLRLEVDDALPGGLAIYGERFGRYPLDPSVIFVIN